MFGLKKERDELIKEIDELKRNLGDRDRLRDQVRELGDQIATLKNKKKIEEEDIKHMVRLKEERLEVKSKKMELDMEKSKQDAIAAVKDQYRDKMEERLESEVSNIKEMYGQILERLPKISVKGSI